MMKTTVDSPNRLRDKTRISKQHPLLVEDGSPDVKIFEKKSGKLLAIGYDRIVYGDHGPYIEFSLYHIKFKNFPQNKVKTDKSYYDEWRTESGKTLLYEQKKTVRNLPNPPAGKYSVNNDRFEGYADYRVGKFYISPDCIYETSTKELEEICSRLN